MPPRPQQHFSGWQNAPAICPRWRLCQTLPKELNGHENRIGDLRQNTGQVRKWRRRVMAHCGYEPPPAGRHQNWRIVKKISAEGPKRLAISGVSRHHTTVRCRLHRPQIHITKSMRARRSTSSSWRKVQEASCPEESALDYGARRRAGPRCPAESFDKKCVKPALGSQPLAV